MFTPEKIARMRACLPFLPEPGSEVAGECLDEIERLCGESERVKVKSQNDEAAIESYLAHLDRLQSENERLRTALEQLADDKDATDRIQTAIDVLNDHDMYEEANNLKVKTNADEH